ncbi:hypothetical protein DNHGIG_26780 [Collibacillus ludicampi]|uniref:Uncharacterized protein n=1 Tax=Collibacillus ludicampi TaxID=2771369 RepID=A0AAV4LH53_9BACL|nr:hypothetical protein DNHGIG_26780 [Collibacillus ludicampi]
MERQIGPNRSRSKSLTEEPNEPKLFVRLVWLTSRKVQILIMFDLPHYFPIRLKRLPQNTDGHPSIASMEAL